jgi:hypothetical protein
MDNEHMDNICCKDRDNSGYKGSYNSGYKDMDKDNQDMNDKVRPPQQLL